MSHWETAEQRQIRELRSVISTLENQENKEKLRNRDMERRIENLIKEKERENEQLLRQMQEERNARERERRQMSEAVRQLDEQVKERERVQNEKIRAMKQEHEAQVRRLEGEFKEERRHLHDEIRQTRSEMKQGLDKLRTDTDRKIREEREENRRNLSQLSARLESRISDVDHKVDALAQQILEREQGDKELATYWAQEAARMLGQIKEGFKDQLLDSKRISVLERKIRNANDDIRGGQYQSSITSGREAFFDALDMKEELAALELEWNYRYNSLKTREEELLQALDSAENRVYEIDTEGEPITYTNGIDYWTYGQLTIARNRINELMHELESTESMTIQELQNNEEKVRELQEELALVENAAHINVAMSLSRYDAAVKIGSILDSNYEMADSAGEFFGREDRDEYHAVFQNPVTGDQAAVVITPIPDEKGVVTNHIDLILGNADNNPVTRARMQKEVEGKLRATGMDGCSFPCAGRFKDRTAEEVARVGDIEAVESGNEKTRAALPQGAAGAASSTSRVKRK